MPANVQTMAYYGEIPWHRLGTPVSMCVTAAEMIRAAGLDWEVRLRPARGARMVDGPQPEYSRYEVVRIPRPRVPGTPYGDESEVLLGLVSARYRPLQNTDAFGFFDDIVGEGKAHFETAGALGQGERVWVMARMPGEMSIVPGDACHRYLLLSNSHTGQGSVIVKFTAVRVVCQNTLMLSLHDGARAFRVRHSLHMQDRLQEVADLLAKAQEVYLETEALFKQFAAVRLPDDDAVTDYLSVVYPPTEKQKQDRREPTQWGHIRTLLRTRRDLQLPKVQGTLWAAYNAVTYYEDYRVPRRDPGTQRLSRMWFGPGAEVKLRALNTAKMLVSQRSN